MLVGEVEGFTNIVPEEEKEGTIRGKINLKKDKEEEEHREEKRGWREYQRFHLDFSWFHHKPNIDRFNNFS